MTRKNWEIKYNMNEEDIRDKDESKWGKGRKENGGLEEEGAELQSSAGCFVRLS